MECHVCNIAVGGGHKYEICNKHVHLICETSEGEGIMAKSSRAQNVQKVKMSCCIIRHFFPLESDQFVNEKLAQKSLSAGAARTLKTAFSRKTTFAVFEDKISK